ncbi:MAG TPA: ATP-binding cassette domain-containing protein [Gemmatimonadaceae bacterium]|nr:ATP-binding cassette domain-containing protein [Vicinamibacterales bacterium]
MPEAPRLSLRIDVSLRQGAFTLQVRHQVESRALALVGPSGAGKTTLLETIAGLRKPDAGEIVVGDRVLFSSARSIDVPSRLRRIGYLPQDALLFPHLNVRRNILYGAGHDSRLALERVLEVLEIEDLLHRRVGGLSGGERQRIALARALMAAPALLLLDEPLAALDDPLRWRIIPYLERIRHELALPIIVASHDHRFVRAIAEAVLPLAGGRVACADGD